MVILEDELFFRTLELLRENIQLPEIYGEMKEILKDNYHINVLNFDFKLIGEKKRICRLHVILSSTEEYESMLSEDGWNFDPFKQEDIAGRFTNLMRKYGFLQGKDLDKIYIYYCDFSSEIKTYINWSAEKELKETLNKKYEDAGIWKIETPFSEVYIFYNTHENMVSNRENGVTESIKKDCLSIIKKYDEFSYFKDDSFVKFDNKENLDENYEGNLFFYFR